MSLNTIAAVDDVDTAIQNALAGLTPGLIESATFVTDRGNGRDSGLAVTVNGADRSPGGDLQVWWEVALLQGSVAEQIRSTANGGAISGADITIRRPDGTTDFELGFIGDMNGPQTFTEASDDDIIATISSTLDRYGLNATSIDILHPLLPAPKIVISIDSVTDLHGDLAKVCNEIVGDRSAFSGIYIEVQLSDGTPVARMGGSYRNAQASEWTAEGYEDLRSGGFSTVPEEPGG